MACACENLAMKSRSQLPYGTSMSPQAMQHTISSASRLRSAMRRVFMTKASATITQARLTGAALNRSKPSHVWVSA